MTQQKKRSSGFTDEFKEEVLAYWASTEDPTGEAARQFGVSTGVRYGWRRKENGLGKVLRYQSVGVLAQPALPGGVRMGAKQLRRPF